MSAFAGYERDRYLSMTPEQKWWFDNDSLIGFIILRNIPWDDVLEATTNRMKFLTTAEYWYVRHTIERFYGEAA